MAVGREQRTENREQCAAICKSKIGTPQSVYCSLFTANCSLRLPLPLGVILGVDPYIAVTEIAGVNGGFGAVTDLQVDDHVI